MPGPDGTADSPSLWGRYRAMPLWLQILIPVVIIALLLGLWAILASGSDSNSTSSDSTVVGGSSLDDTLKGIIIVGGINGQGGTTTTSSSTTTIPATTTTEPATTTTAAATTTIAGVVPPPTSAAPTTAAPTTAAPTTAAPTTEAPTTTVPAGPALPVPADFLAQWNAAAAGTDVPTLSQSQISQIVEGPFAGAFYATLTPTGSRNKLPPQVGIIGTLSATDPTQLSELLLVYVSGPDETASDFYWESFAVLAKAVDPSTTDAQITTLEQSLGRAQGLPPFPDGTNNSADSNGFSYKLSTGTTQSGTPATGIAVS